jgi:hypothetical protein
MTKPLGSIIATVAGSLGDALMLYSPLENTHLLI